MQFQPSQPFHREDRILGVYYGLKIRRLWFDPTSSHQFCHVAVHSDRWVQVHGLHKWQFNSAHGIPISIGDSHKSSASGSEPLGGGALPSSPTILSPNLDVDSCTKWGFQDFNGTVAKLDYCTSLRTKRPASSSLASPTISIGAWYMWLCLGLQIPRILFNSGCSCHLRK